MSKAFLVRRVYDPFTNNTTCQWKQRGYMGWGWIEYATVHKGNYYPKIAWPGYPEPFTN